MKILNCSATLGNQTAIAIENARLYEDLKRSKILYPKGRPFGLLGNFDRWAGP